MDYDKLHQAIKESVQETIDKLGIEAVRKLSWFPSSRK